MPNNRVNLPREGEFLSSDELASAAQERQSDEALALKKQADLKRHILVVIRAAKYVRRSRRRGVKPKRVSKKAQQTIKELRLVTRPRWPKRPK